MKPVADLIFTAERALLNTIDAKFDFLPLKDCQ
jgi:hypothetical protein